MQRLFILFVAAVGVAISGCSTDGGTDDLASEPVTGAAVDAEGIPVGCGDLIAASDGLATAAAEGFSVDQLDDLLETLSRARAVTADESQATTEYLAILTEVVKQAKAGVGADPAASSEAIGVAVVRAATERADRIDELEAEVNAYLERRCPGLIDMAAGLTSGDAAGAGSDSGDDAMATVGGDEAEDGVTMDNQEAEDGRAEAASGAEPVVEPTSVGATGRYKGIEFTVNDVWRTDLDPAQAISEGLGTGTGTGESPVLIKIQVSNEGGGDAQLPVQVFRWVAADGTATIALDGFGPQGQSWELTVAGNTSESRFVLFPPTVGPTAGAVLEVTEQGAVAERIELGLGASGREYPVDLAVGATSRATVQPTSACSYAVDTEIKSAALTLDAPAGQQWLRAKTGQRFVRIDLGMFLQPTSNPAGCFSSIALFQLEPRLKLDNGDTVAPLDKNFDPVEENTDATDPIVFEVPADVEAITLVASDGTVLGSWTDLEVPEP